MFMFDESLLHWFKRYNKIHKNLYEYTTTMDMDRLFFFENISESV